MNSMWKRSFALLLSLVMVFGMLPVNAFATESGETEPVETTAIVETIAEEETEEETTEETTEEETEEETTEETTEEETEEETTEETTEEEITEEEPVVCDGTENCGAETHESSCDCYDWCVALGCTDETHHADCPWGPCTLTEGCELVKDHPGECTGMTVYADVAYIGDTGYASLKDAVAAVAEGQTITLLGGTFEEGSIKLPAALKNVTIQGAANKTSVLKDMTITAADGNTVKYEGLTFNGIVFENSNIVFTGQRNGEVVYKDLVITNCVFRNIERDQNIAAVHFNNKNTEAVNGFTFTKNIIDGVGGSLNSGIFLNCATGNINISNNVINNVAYYPFNAQIVNNDGIADAFTASGNTFSGSSIGRAQALGKAPAGEDSVTLTVNNNIFKDITGTYQICFYNFNSEKTSADLSKNYYDVDIAKNPGKIYYNSEAASTGDLNTMGVFPYYTGLDESGAIDTETQTVPTYGSVTPGYTSENSIWGEGGGNAKESLVVKFFAGETYMGSTSLNNVDGIIDGNVYVTWNMLLDTASNQDAYWTMVWEKTPSVKLQPNRVEMWIDGVKTAENTIQLNGPDGLNPLSVVLGGENGRIVKYEKSAADALTAAKNAGLTEVTIVLARGNTAGTADTFNLYTKNTFDKVTFMQNDATKAYYFDELYTGSRTNGGKFVFDGVNLHVTDQYIFEGNVELTNYSVIASSAEDNCFFYNNTTTIAPGSRLQGVIEDFRGGTVIVDGGKTDGTYSETPGLQDAIMVIRWSGDKLVLKNGAYVNLNSANEVGRLNISAGTSVEVDASKLDAVEYIDLAANGTLQVDTESQVKTRKITGSGKIVIDAKDYTPGKAVPIDADVSAFTGTVETINSKLVKAEIVDGRIVFIGAVAKIGDQGYYSLADALAEAKDNDTVELLSDVTGGCTVDKSITLKGNGKKLTGNLLITADTVFEGELILVGGKVKVTNGATLTIPADAVVTGEGDVFFGAGNDDNYYGLDNAATASGNIVVNGELSIQQMNANAGGKVTIAQGAKMTTAIICVENGAVEGATAGEMNINGNVETQLFNVFGGATVNIGTTGVVSAEQAYTSSGLLDVVNVYGNATLNVSGKLVTAQTEHTEGRHSTMKLEAGSVLNINGGELNHGGTLTNSGIINISGNSKVTAANVTGGTVNVAAGTVLTDTTLGGAAITSFKTGVITFNGENKITTKVDDVNDFDFVVNKGATLLIPRYTLGYGRDITVNGNIVDASTFEPGDATPSLKPNHNNGFSVGGSGNASLTAKNAYIDLVGTTWKNAGAVYNWNFENSYVKATGLGNGNPPGNSSAAWNLTFAGSVLKASAVKAAPGMTFSFTNGSAAETGSLRIDGVLNIDATSSVNVTAYQNNTQGAQDEHGDISGKVNVAGELTIGSNAKTTVELLGAEMNVLKGADVVLGNHSMLVDNTSVLTVAVGSEFGAASIKGNGKIIIDATGYEPGMAVPVEADVTEFTGTVETVGSKLVKAVKQGDKIVFVDAVAKVGDQGYYTFEDAVAAAGETKTIVLLDNIPENYQNVAGIQIATPVKIDLNGNTLKADFVGTLTMSGGSYINASGKPMIAPTDTAASAGFDFLSDDGVFVIAQTGIDITEGTVAIGPVGGTGTYPGHKLQLLNDATLVIPQGKPLVLRGEAYVADTATVEGTVVLEGNATIKTNKELSVASADPAASKVGYVDGIYKLVSANTDAVIGDKEYATLAEAAADAKAGDVIKLVDDVTESNVNISNGVTVDLNGQEFVGTITNTAKDSKTKVTVISDNGITVELGASDKIEYAANGTEIVTPYFESNKGYGTVKITTPKGKKTVATTYYHEKGGYITISPNGKVEPDNNDIKYLQEINDTNGMPELTTWVEQNGKNYEITYVRHSNVTVMVGCDGFLGACKEVWISDAHGNALYVYQNNSNLASHIKVVDGSTKVYMEPAYVNNLHEGTYTVHFLYKDGQHKTQDFIVTNAYTAVADTTNPKTGDEIFVPMFVLFSSTAALAVLLMGKKKFF